MIHFCISQAIGDTFMYNFCMEVNFSKNKIKELRQEKGLSQRELAKATGIKQANISRWEACLVVPNVEDVWILANFFDCSIDYIVGKDEY